MSRRSVAITVATLMAAPLAAVTPAIALPRAVQVIHTPVSCVFSLPTLRPAVLNASDCADGPLAAIAIGPAPGKVVGPGEAIAVPPGTTAVPPGFRVAAAAGPAIAAAPHTGTSIGLVIADQAEAEAGTFFPGRVQPIPPSPIR